VVIDRQHGGALSHARGESAACRQLRRCKPFLDAILRRISATADWRRLALSLLRRAVLRTQISSSLRRAARHHASVTSAKAMSALWKTSGEHG